MYSEHPAGVTSLDLVESAQSLQKVEGRLYVITDDGRDRQFAEGIPDDANRIADLLAQRPDLEVIARFSRPNSSLGVSVLRSR
jgi:hypothetical protein